jgi:hypothetical protein
MNHAPLEHGEATTDVVGWLDAEGSPRTGAMCEHFPRFGRVFVPQHITSQIPIADCAVLDVEMDEHPHEKHNWHATNFVARTYEVLGSPPTVTGPFELFQWCKQPHSTKNGQNDILVELIDGSFVGPFFPLKADSTIKPKSPIVSQWRKQDICKISLPNNGRSIAYPVSAPNRELTFDPTDAIKRLLKLSKENHDLTWLSRDKITQLSLLLTSLIEGGACLWVKDIVQKGLEDSIALADSAQTICESLLSHPLVEARVAEWKTTISAEQRSLAESELARRERAVAGCEKKLADINSETVERAKKLEWLTSEVQRLQSEIEFRQAQAQKSFANEIKRLSEEPTSLLLLRSLLGTSGTPSSGQNLPSLQITEAAAIPARQKADSLSKALSNNLNDCGLAGGESVGLAIAGAIEAGQPVYFHGPFARLLCDAAAESLARPSRLIAETSAGILVPTIWPPIPTDTSVIIHNINMASPELVFGTMIKTVLEQVASGRRGKVDVLATTCGESHFLTMETMPFGPIIDTNLLSFNRRRGCKPIFSEPDLSINSERARDAESPIERQEIEKWDKALAALWHGPFELALKNAGLCLDALLAEDSRSTSVEYLVVWWLAPRASQFKLADLEPNFKRRLETFGLSG